MGRQLLSIRHQIFKYTDDLDLAEVFTFNLTLGLVSEVSHHPGLLNYWNYSTMQDLLKNYQDSLPDLPLQMLIFSSETTNSECQCEKILSMYLNSRLGLGIKGSLKYSLRNGQTTLSPSLFGKWQSTSSSKTVH